MQNSRCWQSQFDAGLTLELTTCVECAENSLRSCDAVLSGFVQLAHRMLRVCFTAQLCLSAWLVRAQAAHATVQAASTDDSATCDIIDLTADDDNDHSGDKLTADKTEAVEQQRLSQHSQMQCKAKPSQRPVLPEQERSHPLGGLPSSAAASTLQPEFPCQGSSNSPEKGLCTNTVPPPECSWKCKQ